MTMQVDLPEDLAGALARRATQQRRTAQEVVIDLLNRALGFGEDEYSETPEQVVARIQALPRNPDALRPAQESVADALQRTITNKDFDLEAWEQQWAKVEAEIRDMTVQDDIREGRR